jgi:eukaryotic-like serine/threonine-protein kinase
MSPEQALGADPELASDVFSLAGVLVYAATGRGPFGEASTAVAMLRRVVDEEPDLSGVAGWLRAEQEPCFAKDPGARPTSRELTDRLSNRGDGPWPPSVTDSRERGALPAESSPTGVTRRRVLAGLACGIPLLGLGIYVATLPAPAPAPSSASDKPIDWQIDMDQRVAAVLIAEDALYAATPSRLYALDPSTGQRHCEVGLGTSAKSGVGLAFDGRNAHLLVGVPDRLSALDPRTGRTVWGHSADGTATPPILPAAGDDTVFAAARGQVRALDPATGEVRWMHPLPDGPISAPHAAAAVCVLATVSQLLAVDATSGRRRWGLALEPGPAPDRVTALVVSDGIAAVPDATGLSAVDARTGAVAWRAQVRTQPAPEPGLAQTVAAGGTLAVLGDGRVHAFALHTGDQRWVYPALRGPGLESIATDGRTVFASGSKLQKTYGLDLATGVSRGEEFRSADILGAGYGFYFHAGPIGGLRAVHPVWT